MSEPRTLKSVFHGAEKKWQALEGACQASSPTFQDDLEFALNSYQECLQIISRISLLSNNESLEDLNTSDLPYLLVSYRIAELLQRASTTTPAERRGALKAARDAYESFLLVLESYSILSPSEAKLFGEYKDDPASCAISSKDPTTRRNAKITNYRYEKELKQKLDSLRTSSDPADGGDENAVRELHLANLALCAHMAFQALDGINREMNMLLQAPMAITPPTPTAQGDDRRREPAVSESSFSERLDRPLQSMHAAFKSPLLSKDGKPLRPFTLTSSRQELAKGVFRPGHNLPTMSIDEYLEEEQRRGGIIQGGGEASGRQPTPDEDDHEKADANTIKAREWDEFTESNPKGSGNTLNRG